MIVQHRLQRTSLGWEFAAIFRTGKAGLSRFYKTHLQRCLAAQLWQVIIAP